MIHLSAAGETDTGTVRKSNQDAIDWRVDEASGQALLIVADGMGGYQGGEVASRIVVDTVMEVLAPALGKAISEEDQKERIQASLDLASERIDQRKEQAPELEKMGTTVVIVWVSGESGLVAHLGDSRCYRIRHGSAECLTRDDTVVQNMLDDGSIREADVPNVPFRNVLTRALGASATQATFGRLTLVPGDRLLLCSDGLNEALAEDDWVPMLAQATGAQSGARELVKACLAGEARDNVSVVLLFTAK